MATPAAITPATPPPGKPVQLEFYDVASGLLIKAWAVEVAPGVHRILEPNIIPPDAMPRHGIFQLVKRPDGTMDPVAITHGTKIKLTTNIGKKLGICGDDGHNIYRTLKRLFYAGFITGEMISADCYYLDLHSLFKYFRAVRNPGWWTKARVEHYKEHSDGPLEDPSGEYWRALRKKVEGFNQGG